MWEQRYGLLQPKRTATNIRYYDDEDLRHVLNVALLNKNGHKISKIAGMSHSEIAEKLADISTLNIESGAQLDALTLSMIEMDEQKFNRIISANISQIGFERTMLEVIYPFLEKLSLLWLTGSIHPVQESFMSYLIRQKLIVEIDKAPDPQGPHIRKFMMYLPEGERQELSVLFMHYLLKSRNIHVIYLGQNISLNDIRDACKVHQPDYLFTMITESFARESVQGYVDKLAEHFPQTQILLSGYQVIAQGVQPPPNVHILNSLDQTLSMVG